MYYTSSSDTWLIFAHAKAFFWVDHCKYYSRARNIRPAQLIWKEYNRCQHNVMRAKKPQHSGNWSRSQSKESLEFYAFDYLPDPKLLLLIRSSVCEDKIKVGCRFGQGVLLVALCVGIEEKSVVPAGNVGGCPKRLECRNGHFQLWPLTLWGAASWKKLLLLLV